MLLSICIPSYNRFEVLNETIKKILKAKSRDFEVVIIDNCSPRNIDDYISTNDSRIRIVKREEPVYGAKNVGDSILYGRGIYSLLLLDKDKIDGNYLDDFIYALGVSDVCGGYCELNAECDSIEIIKEKTIETVGYLSKHPSGDFYKMDIVREYIISKDVVLEKDPFPFDIYLAYCASKGNMMHYNKPVVYSALNDPNAEDSVGSLTFKKENNNLYYLPKKRLEQFVVYVNCLSELNVSLDIKKGVLCELYKRTIAMVSTSYKSAMGNAVVCRHYGHEQKKVGMMEMIRNIIQLRKIYYSVDCSGISMLSKVKLEFKVMGKAIKRFVKGKKK